MTRDRLKYCGECGEATAKYHAFANGNVSGCYDCVCRECEEIERSNKAKECAQGNHFWESLDCDGGFCSCGATCSANGEVVR